MLFPASTFSWEYYLNSNIYGKLLKTHDVHYSLQA